MKDIKLRFKNFVKQNAFGIFSILISTVVFSIVFISSSSGDIKEVEIIKTANFSWLVAAFVCIFSFWFLDGLAIYHLIKEKHTGFGLIPSIKTAIIGIFYSVLTPFAVGGQPMQIINMRKNGVPIGDSTSVITLKTIVYQMVMTAYALVALILTYSFFKDKIPAFNILIITGFTLNILFVAVLLLLGINESLTMLATSKIIDFLNKVKIVKNKDTLKEKFFAQIKVFHEGFSFAKGKKWVVTKITAITVVQITFLYLIPFAIYRCLGLNEQTMVTIIAASAIITMITAFVPTPGGSGAAEGSFYLFFSMIMPGFMVIPALFLWRGFTYYLFICIGGLVSVVDIFIKPQVTKV